MLQGSYASPPRLCNPSLVDKHQIIVYERRMGFQIRRTQSSYGNMYLP
jgi:hypothetical protein